MQASSPTWEPTPTTGNVLSRTLATYRANFLPLFGLAALVNIPLTLLSAYMTQPLQQRMNQLLETMTPTTQGSVPTLDQGTLSQLLGVYSSLGFTAIAIAFIQFVLLYSVITFIASEHQFGQRRSVIEAFGNISSRLPTYSLALIVAAALLLGISYALALVVFLCGFGLGLIAWLGFGLVPFLAPVMILERSNVTVGLTRTFSLAKLHLWSIVRVTVLLGLLIYGVNLVIGYLLPSASIDTFNTNLLIILIVTGVIDALLLPLFPIAFTVLYYDARVRYEGLDTALVTVGKADARPADVVSPPAGRLFEGRDMSTILIMTLLVIGLIIVVYVALIALFVVLNPNALRNLP